MPLEGEATPTTETAAAATTSTPTPTPSPPPAEPKVEIVQMTRAEYDVWHAEREQAKRDVAEKELQRIEAEEKAARNAMEKGHFDKAFEKWRALDAEKEARLVREKQEAIDAEKVRSASEIKLRDEARTRAEIALREKDSRAKRYAVDGELGRALAGHNLAEGSAGELTELLRPKLQVEEHGESFAVKSPDGLSVAEFVESYLKRNPHHVKASVNRGGTIGGGGSSATSPTPQPTPTEPQWKNLGEQLLSMTTTHHGPTEAARYDMSKPIGLSRAKVG